MRMLSLCNGLFSFVTKTGDRFETLFKVGDSIECERLVLQNVVDTFLLNSLEFLSGDFVLTNEMIIRNDSSGVLSESKDQEIFSYSVSQVISMRHLFIRLSQFILDILSLLEVFNGS